MTETTKNDLHAAPLSANLADVVLIDAAKCAATGDMSVSWWHEQVRSGRAPQPVVRKPRCTRWRMADVRAFWQHFAAQGGADAGVAQAVIARATTASKAARAAAEK